MSGDWGRPRRARVLACVSGNTAVEFALISPLLIAFVIGIICYGGYFWISHNVQQLANDAARASIAGLTAAERESLARSALTDEVDDYDVLDASAISLRFTESGDTFTVSVTYDASGSPYFDLASFVPMPSSTIVRTATIRMGGY